MEEEKPWQCPECQTAIPVVSGYPIWCDQCGWNIHPYKPDPPRNIFESFYASIGKKHGQALLDQMVKAEAFRPILSLSKLLAFSLAAVIHLLTLVFAIL